MKPVLKIMLIVLLVAGLGGVARTVQAAEHDKLVPMLVEMKGWKSDPGKGNSMSSGTKTGGGTLKIITAQRTYKRGNKSARVSLMVNSGPPPANQIKDYKMEMADRTITTKKIDDFWVSTTDLKRKDKKLGKIYVNLVHSEKSHALLVLDFNGMKPEEAIAFAKKFNWSILKQVTAKML